MVRSEINVIVSLTRVQYIYKYVCTCLLVICYAVYLALTQKGKEDENFEDKHRKAAQYLIHRTTYHFSWVTNSIAIMKTTTNRKSSIVMNPNWYCQTALFNLSHLQSEKTKTKYSKINQDGKIINISLL